MSEHVWYSVKWDMIYIEPAFAHYWWLHQVVMNNLENQYVYLGEL